MNLREAYTILDLEEGADEATAKKKYRELTKKFHPDINKEPGAEDRFKKINEAYEVVTTKKESGPQESFYRPRYGNNPFSSVPNVPTIELSETISFKESILGGKKELKFNRIIKCSHCNGQGAIPQNNGCDQCGGKGVIINQRGNMIMTSTCPKCYGRVKANPCNDCKTTGVSQTETSVTVSIPGGITGGSVLRLGGIGNFAGMFMGIDQYADVHLKIIVMPLKDLRLEGMNVYSNVDISLKEALLGCSKNVTTINGSNDISIPPLSKNKDEIKIPNLGVNGVGSHQVVLNVKYPEDISKLLTALD